MRAGPAAALLRVSWRLVCETAVAAAGCDTHLLLHQQYPRIAPWHSPTVLPSLPLT